MDGAQPGVIMPARPRVGMRYRQEYYKGQAEDRARIFSLRERAPSASSRPDDARETRSSRAARVILRARRGGAGGQCPAAATRESWSRYRRGRRSPFRKTHTRLNGSRNRLHRQDRRAEGHHRDGPAVRRQRGPPDRRGARPRGHVPRRRRRADEGARPVRGHDPRGVRGDGARPHDLRDDRRGALARLDLGLRHRQHALHRLLPAHEVRDRRAEAGAAPADGHR